MTNDDLTWLNRRLRFLLLRVTWRNTARGNAESLALRVLHFVTDKEGGLMFGLNRAGGMTLREGRSALRGKGDNKWVGVEARARNVRWVSRVKNSRNHDSRSGRRRRPD